MYSGLVRCYSTTEKKKYNKAVQRDKVKMDKIEIDADKKAEISLGPRQKKKEGGGGEGSRVVGYTFLWLQNTLSFNKGRYILLCVI